MIATRTLTLAGAAMLFPVLAMAQVNSTNQGYLVNGPDFNVVTAVGGTVCVRTSDWTPARAAAAKACQQCTPDLCPKPVAAAPAPKAAPPAPAQPAAPARPAPEKMLPQKINFSADALFDFDKAVLKPEGKAALDSEVIDKLKDVSKLELVLVTGHTDRIGTQEYNQRLSERRANTVRDYLVSRGVARDKIETLGMGKTQPIPGVVCNQKNMKELIACLAPNRRVEVEVKGEAVRR
jgi:OOP family OmpA-OmpF porin